MVKESVEVTIKTGLQARPAAFFVQEANKFTSDIHVEKEDKRVNAKSIMGIMSLAIGQGADISIIAEGIDEKEAVDSLIALLNSQDNE